MISGKKMAEMSFRTFESGQTFYKVCESRRETADTPHLE